LIGAVAENSYVSVAFLSLSLAGTQLTEGSFWAATASVSGKNAGTASGLLNTGGNVVGGIGALLVPIIAKYLGWTMAISSGCIFALIAAVLWFFIRSDVPMVQKDVKS
jgi:ACS family glucarate transporter-like MFS transporter